LASLRNTAYRKPQPGQLRICLPQGAERALPTNRCILITVWRLGSPLACLPRGWERRTQPCRARTAAPVRPDSAAWVGDLAGRVARGRGHPTQGRRLRCRRSAANAVKIRHPRPQAGRHDPTFESIRRTASWEITPSTVSEGDRAQHAEHPARVRTRPPAGKPRSNAIIAHRAEAHLQRPCYHPRQDHLPSGSWPRPIAASVARSLRSAGEEIADDWRLPLDRE
jgi:hypothetical protein